MKTLCLRLALILGLFFAATFFSSCYSDPHYQGYRGGYYGPPAVSYTTGYYYRNQYYNFHDPRYSGRYAYNGRYAYPNRGGSYGGGPYHYPREGGGSAGAPRPNQGRGNANSKPSSGRGGSGPEPIYYNPRAGVYPAPPPRGGNAPQKPRNGGGGESNRRKR